MAKQDALILSHWHHLLENFSESSQNLYNQVEQKISQKNIPDAKVSRIDYKEGECFRQNESIYASKGRRSSFRDIHTIIKIFL